MFGAILIFTGTAAAVAAIVNIVGANLYDIEQLRFKQSQKRHPYSQPMRQRPLVSLIVAANNNRAEVLHSLDSLAKSSYRQLEIIVADNASTDGVKKAVQTFSIDHPTKRIRFYGKRRPSAYEAVIAGALKTHVKGEIVMLLEAGAVVDKTDITKAVIRFNLDPNLSGVRANYKLQPHLLISGLFQDYSLLLKQKFLKASSAYKLLDTSNDQGATFYRRSTLSKLVVKKDLTLPLIQLGDKTTKFVYADEIVVYGKALNFKKLISVYYAQKLRQVSLLSPVYLLLFNSSRAYSRSFKWLKLPAVTLFNLISLGMPLLLGFFIYMAFDLHEALFLAISWGAGAVYLSFAVLEASPLQPWRKLRYIVLMPIAYSWFYFLLVLQYAATLNYLLMALKNGLSRLKFEAARAA